MSFGEPPEFEHLTHPDHQAMLVRLRSAVAPILANNLLPHFTDHSVAHSDNLTRLVDALAKPLQTSCHALAPKELIILYSSCYLHDIGMQYENAGDTDVIASLQLARPWTHLPEPERREFLRRYHHRISAEMVHKSVRAQHPLIGLQMTTDYDPSRVASLCHAHNIETDSDEYRQQTQDGPGIRLALISGLLRLADILDEARRRASREKGRTLALDLYAQTHWWRHYYTEDVTFDQHRHEVCIWFDFPPIRFDEYQKVLPALQIPWIEAEFGRHRSVFHQNGLAWSLTHRSSVKQYSDTDVMPDAVLTDMLKQLMQRHRSEEERRRLLALQHFTEAQPQLDRRHRQLEAKKSALQPADYLRELSFIAFDMWDLGGRRNAWMLLLGEFERTGQHLPLEDRFTIGTRLLSMLLEDDMADRAVPVLRQLATELPQLQSPVVAWGFARTHLTVLVDLCAYSEALAAGQEAIRRALTDDDRATVRSLLAEIRLLQGESPVLPVPVAETGAQHA